MTRKLKITPGKFEQDNGFLYCATIKGSVAIFDNTTPSQDVANAELCAEAMNVANETGLMPRELLAQRDELLAAAERAIGVHNAPSDCYATGPLTGDSFRDLVECPACALLALIARVRGES